MNPTPTISEAARRAAKTIEEEYVRSPRDGAAKRDIASIIQSALDSAHPAPKEGITPETDAQLISLHWTSMGYKVSKPNIEEAVLVPADFARSLELRLSEAKREVEAAWKEAKKWQDLGQHFDEQHDNDMQENIILRSHLKTANELLGETVERFAALAHQLHTSASSVTPSVIRLRQMADDATTGASRVRTHLNQQSK